jgi:hypothetical protein
MKIGMLWFDNSQAPLPEKVERACDYYKKKYGTVPDWCHVHPTTEGAPVKVNGIDVQTNHWIRPNHLWMGVKDERQRDQDPELH